MPKNKQVEGQLSFADFLLQQTQPAPEPENKHTLEEPSGGKEDLKEDSGENRPGVEAEPVKKQKEATGSAEDVQFEEEFAKLMQLFDSIRTDDFNAMDYLSPIANAVKTMESEQVSFEEALVGHCSKYSAEKILAAFSDQNRQKLFAIILGMHDEI